MKKSITTSSVVGLLFAFGLTPAFAVDAKIYAGSECVETYTSGHDAWYVHGRAINTNISTSITMECPVVKEIVGDTSLASAHFYVTDLHPRQDVNCSLITRDGANPSTGYYTTRRSAGRSFTPQKLTYPAQRMIANTGYTVFRCILPPNITGQMGYESSGLVSYRVDE
jgi:hypothetical protein